MTTFDAGTIARGWLSVAVASGKDSGRAQLDRTIAIEAFSAGVRLIATDSIVLLRSWVPNIEYPFEPEPELEEVPYATAIAMDPHGRARGFLAHARRLAAEADKAHGEPVEVRLNLGVVDEVDEEDRLTLAGMDARYVVLELPDVERLKLLTYEGVFIDWRQVAFTGKKTAAIALNPDVAGSLAKLGRIQPGTVLGFEWGGPLLAARFELGSADPTVCGLVMPCRWDFARNAPREDDDPPDAGDDDR